MSAKITALVTLAMLACTQAEEPQPAARAVQPAAPAPAPARGVILFLGTSLTAGYGVGVEHAYPALVQAKLDSAGYALRVVNAGLSGETSAGGLRRLEWSLQQPIEILVLELGANDGLRGLPVAQLRANLDSIITITRRSYPAADVLIAGMLAPPNLGSAYTTAFRATYRDLARKHEAQLVPFLLEGVAAQPSLNLDDGIHPNRAGHRRIAATIWQALQPLLKERRPARSGARAATG